MEEIDLRDLYIYLLKNKFKIIIIILVTMLLGALYTIYLQKPMYRSYTTVLLTQVNDNRTIENNDVLLNKNLIDTYREIIKSTKIIRRVKNELNLDSTTDELKKNINVENLADTEIIKITVTDKDSSKAMNIANKTAEVFNEEIVKLYKIENVGMIDIAEEASNPYNINYGKTVLMSFCIGLIISFAIIFIQYYFDNSIKGIDDIEKRLGIPVIGSIPSEGE